MTTVIFVHGTGVRQPHFERVFRRVANGVSDIDAAASTLRCYWGDVCGARLHCDGKSIPNEAGVRSLDGADELELWTLMETDPLYELRLLAAERGLAGELPPDAVSPSRRMGPRVSQLIADSKVVEAVAAADLLDTFSDAVTAVLGASPTQEALASVVATPDELAAAVARAIVAEAMVRADDLDGGLRPVGGDHRDALVTCIAEILSDDTRGVFGRLALAGLQVALELGATRKVERERAAITRVASPLVGDILLYLARGDALRQFIADTVTAVADDVVLLAHSLGGVACVDMLVERPPANVKGLITVGSQAPLLYELGALPKLDPTMPLPETVPVPWINVYDVRDLLSFVAQPIFGDRVRDVRIDSRAPFPRSHSAYFTNPALYRVVGAVLKAVRS